jgi:hypothetical protein
MNGDKRVVRWLATSSCIWLLVLAQGCEYRKSAYPPLTDKRETSDMTIKDQPRRAGLVGGVAGDGTGGKEQVGEIPDRKVIRSAVLELLVDDVPKVAEHIEALARRYGGYADSTEVSHTKGLPQRGQVTVRVPAARFDEVRAEMKRLAAFVESDKTEARDVTKQFVDSEARLRNYQAEERQYLEIMRRATKVADTLNAAEHLSDVRGRIEQLQGELKYLTQQVEMASIAVNLRVESVGQSSQWRPWYQTKLAFADMMEGLQNFADSVIYLIVMLPVIILWGALAAVLGLLLVKAFFWTKGRVPLLSKSLQGKRP